MLFRFDSQVRAIPDLAVKSRRRGANPGRFTSSRSAHGPPKALLFMVKVVESRLAKESGNTKPQVINLGLAL